MIPKMEAEVVQLTEQLGEEEKALEALQEACKGAIYIYDKLFSSYTTYCNPALRNCVISANLLIMCFSLHAALQLDYGTREFVTSCSVLWQARLKNIVSYLILPEWSSSLGRSTSLNAKAKLVSPAQLANSWKTKWVKSLANDGTRVPRSYNLVGHMKALVIIYLHNKYGRA